MSCAIVRRFQRNEPQLHTTKVRFVTGGLGVYILFTCRWTLVRGFWVHVSRIRRNEPKSKTTPALLATGRSGERMSVTYEGVYRCLVGW